MATLGLGQGQGQGQGQNQGFFPGFRNPSETSVLSTGAATASVGVFGLKEFMESNSYVAKFAFILMVFILFMIFLRLGVLFLAWIFSPGTNPTLLDGTITADDMRVISQDPKDKSSVPIIRSTNESAGIEFTWSVWVNITKPPSNVGYSRVFNKGTSVSKIQTGEDAGIYVPNNAPGLYVKNDKDGSDNVVTLAVIMNVANSAKAEYFERL